LTGIWEFSPLIFSCLTLRLWTSSEGPRGQGNTGVEIEYSLRNTCGCHWDDHSTWTANCIDLLPS